MFNTIIEIKRENKEGQLNIKINLYHNNEKELNKVVKATNKFKFYNDDTITNNDGSLSYTKATNVITINNIAEELLDFDNNIKELEKLFVDLGAEPLILEGYLRATDKKEYKEEIEKTGNEQNIEENTKNNNMDINELKEKLEIVKEDLQDDTKQLNKIEIKLLYKENMDYKTYKATMSLYNRAKDNIEKDKEIIKTLEDRLLKALEEEEKQVNTVKELDFQEVNNDMVKDARLEYNIN